MTDFLFLEKVKQMPPDSQQEVKDFIDFVWEKKLKHSPDTLSIKRKPGMLKGKMWMSPDFDEPLEDFKDYM